MVRPLRDYIWWPRTWDCGVNPGEIRREGVFERCPLSRYGLTLVVDYKKQPCNARSIALLHQEVSYVWKSWYAGADRYFYSCPGGFRSKQAPRIGQVSRRSNQRLQKVDKRAR